MSNVKVVTGVVEHKNIAHHFKLNRNCPNPFNPTTVIIYQLPVNSFVTLNIYDVLGREIQTLVNEHQSAGTHSVTFNEANLPSGAYLYRIQAGIFTDVKKFVVVK